MKANYVKQAIFHFGELNTIIHAIENDNFPADYLEKIYFNSTFKGKKRFLKLAILKNPNCTAKILVHAIKSPASLLLASQHPNFPKDVLRQKYKRSGEKNKAVYIEGLSQELKSFK